MEQLDGLDLGCHLMSAKLYRPLAAGLACTGLVFRTQHTPRVRVLLNLLDVMSKLGLGCYTPTRFDRVG